MDENNNKDMLEEELETVTSDEASLDEEVSSEIITEEAESAVDEAAEVVEDTTDAVEDKAEAVEEKAETVEDTAEADLTAPEETQPADAQEEDAQPEKKKRSPLQVPVIIALCLVVALLLGYFAYTAFFLREPEGVTWAADIDGLTYYIDFNSDNTFNAYIGSIEVDGTYTKAKNQPKQDYTGATVDESEKVNTLTLDYQIAYFYPGYGAEYTITGSRILGNQVLSCSYGQGYDFTFNQAKRQEPALEVSADFKPDEALVGSWIFNYEGADIYKMTINADGTMSIKKFQEGSTYNGTYTVSDNQINFTYYVNDYTAVPLDYSLNGDILTCMSVNFVREGSGATPDQPFVVTDEAAQQ